MVVQSLFAQLNKKLFLIAGQSNAVGQGDSSLSAQYINANSYDFNILTKRFHRLTDPVGQNWKMLETANSGSIVPALAHTLSTISNEAVYMVSAARGGSS